MPTCRRGTPRSSSPTKFGRAGTRAKARRAPAKRQRSALCGKEEPTRSGRSFCRFAAKQASTGIGDVIFRIGAGLNAFSVSVINHDRNNVSTNQRTNHDTSDFGFSVPAPIRKITQFIRNRYSENFSAYRKEQIFALFGIFKFF